MLVLLAGKPLLRSVLIIAGVTWLSFFFAQDKKTRHEQTITEFTRNGHMS